MSLRRVAVIGIGVILLACDSAPRADAPSVAGDLPPVEPEVLYAIGSVLADQVKAYHLNESEVRELARGFSDAALGKPIRDPRASDEMGAKVREFHETRSKAIAQREELAGAFLIEQAEREPGAIRTAGGAVLRVIEPGTGPKPRIFDVVTVNYRGTLRDGTVFHSNEGKPPEQLQLGVNTRCWQEALGAVSAGARLQLVCPPALSYGWGGWPAVVPGGAVLRYEIELVAVEQKEPPPGWQPDWEAAPPTIGSPKESDAGGSH